MNTDYVGIAEIAKRLGVTRAAVCNWRARQGMPEPEIVVSGSPGWRWEVIKSWADTNGYPKAKPPRRLDRLAAAEAVCEYLRDHESDLVIYRPGGARHSVWNLLDKWKRARGEET